MPRVWDYARTKHQEAADNLRLYQDDGLPFVLALRDFGDRLTFPGTSFDRNIYLENNLFEQYLGRLNHRGPSGKYVGIIQVQQQEPDGYPSREAYSPDIWQGSVYAPSFYLSDSDWPEAVASLIWKAELIVVTLTRAGHGLLMELGEIALTGRADRTVVIFAERQDDNRNKEVLELPVLKPFARVISHLDVNQGWPMDTFVFEDLDDRLMSILRTPRRRRRQLVQGDFEYRVLSMIEKPPGQQNELTHREFDRAFPISWTGVGEGYQALEASCRAEGRRAAAARYLDSAARIATIRGDA